MDEKSSNGESLEQIWHHFLTDGIADHERQRHLFRLLPGDPRCKFCYVPFQGVGASLAKLIYGKGPSSLNPRYCNFCETFAKENQGGAEVPIAMLFADVRGSTGLAERMGASAFSQLIDRFYRETTNVLIKSDAMIDKLIGDEVVGIYVPGFAGPDYLRRAIEAAMELLRVTGHGKAEGPWIPVGAGIHSGKAFVGSVGSKEGVSDITALGDVPNTAARLASQAGIGELIVSQDAFTHSGLSLGGLETRRLELKGRSKPVEVRVIRIAPN